MKKSKILLFLLLFLFIPNVNATNVSNWASDINSIQVADIYTCYSSGCSALSSSSQIFSDEQGITRYAVTNTELDAIGNYGMGIKNYVGYLSPNTLYSYNIYFCSNKALGSTEKEIYTNPTATFGFDGIETQYSLITYKSLSTSPIKSTNETFSCTYAYNISTIFQPSVSNTNISINFSSSSSITSVQLTFLGWNLEALGNAEGLSTSDIEEVIANSNLATATSIEEVQTSVEEVKTELNELNQEQAETNDILNDDSVDDSIDLGSSFFGDVADTTPTGGLGEFLVIPLTFVQSLLEEDCSPISLPLPFLDLTLTLPCMNAFWSKMGALKTLLNVVWLAVVGSRILSGIFQLTVEAVDTNPNKSDPVCLKTWEL